MGRPQKKKVVKERGCTVTPAAAVTTLPLGQVGTIKGRRQPRPPLFRFYKINRPQLWLDQPSVISPAALTESDCGQRGCQALLWPFKTAMNCVCCPSWCRRFSILEYKYEATMVIQVLCILLGIIFIILKVASGEHKPKPGRCYCESTSTSDSTPPNVVDATP